MKKKSSNKELWGKKQIFSLKIEPYNKECWVVVNGQYEDFIKHIKKLKNKNEYTQHLITYFEKNSEQFSKIELHTGHARTYFDEDNTGYVVLVSHCNDWRKTVNLTSHEVLHLVTHVLGNAGLNLNYDTEEAYAYLLAHTTEEILKRMYL